MKIKKQHCMRKCIQIFGLYCTVHAFLDTYKATLSLQMINWLLSMSAYTALFKTQLCYQFYITNWFQTIKKHPIHFIGHVPTKRLLNNPLLIFWQRQPECSFLFPTVSKRFSGHLKRKRPTESQIFHCTLQWE